MPNLPMRNRDITAQSRSTRKESASVLIDAKIDSRKKIQTDRQTSAKDPQIAKCLK